MGDWMVLMVPVIFRPWKNNNILGYELWQILREFIFTHFHGWFCRWFTAVAGPLKLRSWLQQVQLHIESRPKLGKSASIDMIPYRNEQLLVMQNRELEKEFPLKDGFWVGAKLVFWGAHCLFKAQFPAYTKLGARQPGDVALSWHTTRRKGSIVSVVSSFLAQGHNAHEHVPRTSITETTGDKIRNELSLSWKT